MTHSDHVVAMETVSDLYRTDMIAHALTEVYGERCAVFDPECLGCLAWAELHGLKLLASRLAKQAPAWQDVVVERQRQIEVEGWTAEHDEQHYRGELAQAAATYAFVASLSDYDRTLLSSAGSHVAHLARSLWPNSWDGWFKPKSRRQDLVRSAALSLAAIERLDRLVPSPVLGEPK